MSVTILINFSVLHQFKKKEGIKIIDLLLIK